MVKFYVGTSGWSYLRWDKEFYPSKLPAVEKLSFYASQFNAVELNSTFYRLPEPKQFAIWEKEVANEFIFAVKASRYITHMKRLKEPKKTLPRFLKTIKKQTQGGPVFFQLPPGFPLNLERLEEVLQMLPSDRRYVFEFREPSWHAEKVYRLLRKHRVSFCLYDTIESISPRIMTTDFAYVRLRGRKTKSLDKFLRGWHAWLIQHSKKAYVFFDNREEKNLAFGNALAFRALVAPDGQCGARAKL